MLLFRDRVSHLPNSPSWMVSQSQEAVCVCLHPAENTRTHHHTWSFYMDLRVELWSSWRQELHFINCIVATVQYTQTLFLFSERLQVTFSSLEFLFLWGFFFFLNRCITTCVCPMPLEVRSRHWIHLNWNYDGCEPPREHQELNPGCLSEQPSLLLALLTVSDSLLSQNPSPCDSSLKTYDGKREE